jgi:hypothetical protein
MKEGDMFCTLADLDQDKLSRIQAWEEKNGSTVLAFSCSDIQAAVLDQTGLDDLQGIEKELGLSLVAVKT